MKIFLYQNYSERTRFSYSAFVGYLVFKNHSLKNYGQLFEKTSELPIK